MRRIVLTCVLAAIAAACGRTLPMLPTPSTPAAGIWSGNVSVRSTITQMTWSLTQNGSSVVGPIRIGWPGDRPLLNGYLSGAVNGSTLTYTVDVPAGDIPAAPACAGRLVGSATIARGTPSTLVGAYTFSPTSCDGSPLAGGTFTLTSGASAISGPNQPS
jgi:hypothetical protein